MVQQASTHELAATPSRRSGVTSAVVAGGAIVGVVLLVGAVVLWAHYGTAVFFEMIVSGIAACI